MRKSTICIFLLFSVTLLKGQSKEAEIDSIVQLFVEYTHFNGSVLAAENGEVVYKNAFGYANMEWQIPNTTKTRFKLASLGKQFTALLIMQMVEEGKIELTGKICDYIPDYPKESGTIITIHQLLTHTSGIPNYHVISDYSPNQGRAYTRDEYLNLFKNKPLMFTPGTQSYYSNLGYFVLGYILEKVSGKSYTQLLKEKIFEPAGMTNSNCEEEKHIIPNMAYGYNFIYTGYEPAHYRHPSQVFGAGNIMTTVEDFLKYDQALHNNILLSEKYLKQINTRHPKASGYGWNISTYPKSESDSVTLATHDGGTFGFVSVAYRFLEDKKLIVVFSNSSPYDVYGLASSIGRVLYNRKRLYPKKSYVEEFAVTVSKFSVDSAVTQFHFLKKNEPDLYSLESEAFNLLGYSYLESRQFEAAIAVFKINVGAFPDDGNLYDSLAEAYMLNGQRELAIFNYKKALELDPNNSNSKVMLAKLLESK
ncbi:MAG: serine hydrolase [Bacteroidia bacterium]|nr:serine hydrolase [Bacteroidia bacterium]